MDSHDAEADTLAFARAAVACLAGPTSLLAVAVLLLNDHVLKSLCPSWLTGKLSDFAGLYFAPYLCLFVGFMVVWLAQRFSSGGQTCRLTATAAEALATSIFVGLGALFAALKLSPSDSGLARQFIALALGEQVAIAADPSDLLALGMLPLAYLGWRRQAATVEAGRRWRDRPATSRTPPAAGRARHLQPACVARQSSPRSKLTARRVGLIGLLGVVGFAVVATSPAPWQPGVRDIVADARCPGTLYAVAGYYALSPSTSGVPTPNQPPATYLSVDGGDSWARTTGLEGHLVADPARCGAFYLARSDGLWHYTNRGLASARIWPPSGQPSISDPLGPVAVAPPWAADLVYVGTLGAVSRTSDGGATWTTLPLPGQPTSPVTALAYVASRPGLLFAAQDRTLFRSEDGGATWSAVGTMNPPVAALAVSPANPDLLLAIANGSLTRSADGGRTWTDVTWLYYPSGGRGEIAFDPVDGRTVYAAFAGASLRVSADGGETWREPVRNAYGVTVAPDGTAYVAADREGALRERGWLRWPWMGEWQHVNEGLPMAGRRDAWDRAGSLASWLVVATVLFALVRLATPPRLRRFVLARPWEVCLAAWAAAASAALVWGLTQASSSNNLDDAMRLAALAFLGLVVILLRTPLSWLTFGLAALPALLMIVAVALGIGQMSAAMLALAPTLGVGLLSVLVVGALVAAAMALRSGKSRVGKALLVAAIVLGVGPTWVALVILQLLSGAFG